MIIYTGLGAAGQKIALRPDGLHALPMAADTARLALWTKESDFRKPQLPLALNSPCCELTDVNTAVVASPGPASFGNGPIIFTEFGLSGDPLPILDQFNVGDRSSRWGASCKLRNGGIVFVNSRDLDGFFHFDVTYRRFTTPATPSPVASPWLKQYFSCPHNMGTMLPATLSMVDGPEGLVWLFFASDSMGTVARIRFRCTDQIELVDYQEDYVPDKHPYSINGEIPGLVAIPEYDKNRILLGYEDAVHSYTGCLQTSTHIVSQHCVILAAYVDRIELVTLLDWPAEHPGYPVLVPWGRPEGVYFVAPYYDVPNCQGGIKSGLFDGQVRVAATTMKDKVLSYSDDGWILSAEPNSDGFHTDFALAKQRFRPKLKIVKTGSNVRLSWDEPSAADQLQVSTDLKIWSNFGTFPAMMPVITPANSAHQFFRLVQK